MIEYDIIALIVMLVCGALGGVFASLCVFTARVVFMDWLRDREKWAFYGGYEYASGRRESVWSAEAERAWKDAKERLYPENSWFD
jgi:hypothetical protein